MIEINDKIFNTKVKAEDFIRTILYKYPLNTPIEEEDLVFICTLIDLHPNKEEKVGVGIKSVIVEKDARFKTTTHFSIIRIDGTKIDVSFKKCITPSMNDPMKLFRAAARKSIADQIISFRDIYFKGNQNSNGYVQCAISGELVRKNNSHIDHIPPRTFDKLISDFIDINKINVGSVNLVETESGIGREFLDSNLKDKFSEYHRKNAKLRVTSPLSNLTQKKK